MAKNSVVLDPKAKKAAAAEAKKAIAAAKAQVKQHDAAIKAAEKARAAAVKAADTEYKAATAEPVKEKAKLGKELDKLEASLAEFSGETA